MKFSAVHKIASYLMATCAYLALALANELPIAVIVLGGAGIAGSWFWEPPRIRPERWTLVWNTAAVGAFGYTVLSALSGAEWVIAGADFLVFLLVAKLFTRRSSRDYLWIYVITLLMLLAGTTLNGDMSYAFCFLGYVITATWALILFHLRREMEDNFLLKHSDDASSERVEVERILSSRRIVGPPFLVATAAASVAIFVLSSLLFFVFPRVGFGFFFQRGRGHLSFAGFSDGVELGKHGLIRNDDTVVMRIQLDDPRWQGPAAPELHWRAVAFDHYERGRWSRTKAAFGTRPKATRYAGSTQFLLEGAVRFPNLKGTVRQEISLEPLDTAALFAASAPLAFELTGTFPGQTVYGGANDEIRFPHYAGLRYVAYSDPTPPAPERLAQAPDADPHAFATYLQLPPELPPRVAELGRQITRGAAGPYAKAEAVLAFLHRDYGYTLEMKSDDRYEPLDYFLFERKKGHCEYFSSAMAILLRAAGVPTRNVDGFLGGEWNEYGKYIAVRSGDAHSWVEVWFDGVGWVTYDPTPPAPDVGLGRGGGDLLDKLRRMLDTLRLSWFKWVMDYDLSRQLGLMKDIADTLGFGAGGRLSTKAVSAWLRAHRGLLGTAAGGLILLGLAVAVVKRRRSGGPRPLLGRSPDHVVVAMYRKAARTLARRGYPRPPGQTPREHASTLVARAAPGASPYAALTEMYYVARYGESEALAEALDVAEARRLAAAVREARPS